MLPANEIICGKAGEVLKTLPDESVNCCISSPPYWALRDYGVDGQLGLEKTFEEYIDKLCSIYDEVKRVLRKDGTCFVNLGDTYAGGGRGYEYWTGNEKQSTNKGSAIPKCPETPGVQDKSLCLIPQRFAIEMVNRGWILRNVIIWHKPNPMPSSAKDRFTVDFEYVYFFVKQKRYFFEPQYEPNKNAEDDLRRIKQAQQKKGQYKDDGNKESNYLEKWSLKEPQINPLGRNKRTVWEMSKKDWDEYCNVIWQKYEKQKQTQANACWTIPTQACPEAHFATYPEKLVEPMIKAGCPEFVCEKCGKGRVKIYKKGEIVPDAKGYKPRGNKGDNKLVNRWNTGEEKLGPNMHYEQTFKGYTDCGCGAGFRPGIVLDPFAGSGTTCLVAARLRRDYIGIELKAEYIEEIAADRVVAVETGVPVKEQKQGQKGLFDG